MKRNGHFIFVFYAVLSLSILGCSPSVPTDTDVQNYLKSSVPGWLSIDSVKTKSFMTGKTGSGRTSVTLRLLTKEDLFEQASQKDIEQQLPKWNLSIGDLRKFDPNRFQVNPFYFTSHQKGEAFDKAFDLMCEEKVNGWAFGGSIDTSAIRGQPRSALPVSAIIFGTPESERYFVEIADKKKVSDARRTKYVNGLRAYFAKEQIHRGTYCSHDQTGFRQAYPITLTLTDHPVLEATENQKIGIKVSGVLHWDGEMPKYEIVTNEPLKRDNYVYLLGEISVPEREGGQLGGTFDLLWYSEKSKQYFNELIRAKLVGSAFEKCVASGLRFSLDPVDF